MIKFLTIRLSHHYLTFVKTDNMNRLMIIGNGFDLAHKLPTKYCDFINDYWQKIKNSEYEDEFFKFAPGFTFNNYKNFSSIRKHYEERTTRLMEYNPLKKKYLILGQGNVIEVKNEFFHNLNLKRDDVGWVDIEMEYYNSLKSILQRKPKSSADFDDYAKESLRLVTALNNEVQIFKDKFESYLKNNVIPLIASNDYYIPKMEILFGNALYTQPEMQAFYKEFPHSYVVGDLHLSFKKKFDDAKVHPRFTRTCILNFNYTDTFQKYAHPGSEAIYIHDQIGRGINMGFGDEKDKFYDEIEDLNQNEYLRFIKSFQYSKNNRYKQLSDFIEGGDYQVQILGHSCGLSDRTLLKSIFENRNCKSIKIFYHSTENGTDHTNLVQNISRHFSDKVSMRAKIVDETLCSELPQKLTVDHFYG